MPNEVQEILPNAYDLLGGSDEPKQLWSYYIKTHANEGRDTILNEELARNLRLSHGIIYSPVKAGSYIIQNYHTCVEANHIASRVFCFNPQYLDKFQCLQLQNENNATTATTFREILERFYARRFAKPIPVIHYSERVKVENWLDPLGLRVLKFVLDLATNTVSTRAWPLQKIKISHVNDPEIKTWEYILIVFQFDCDFNTADNYLHEFYQELDKLTVTLNQEEKSIIQGALFFDIEAVDNISSY